MQLNLDSIIEAALQEASQSPYGAMWLATGLECWVGAFAASIASQSPYGAKWFATAIEAEVGVEREDNSSQSPYGAKWLATGPPGTGKTTWLAGEVEKSQSPCGAKWFATVGEDTRALAHFFGVAIPLRGYVVCNKVRKLTEHPAFLKLSQSPYGARWFATDRVALRKAPFTLEGSQSPYGAKWFATPRG